MWGTKTGAHLWVTPDSQIWRTDDDESLDKVKPLQRLHEVSG